MDDGSTTRGNKTEKIKLEINLNLTDKKLPCKTNISAKRGKLRLINESKVEHYHSKFNENKGNFAKT